MNNFTHCHVSSTEQEIVFTMNQSRMKPWIVAGFLMLAGFVTPSDANILQQLNKATADIVEKVMPSVVVVRTEATSYRFYTDYWFGRSFRVPEKLAGQGSGVIIDKKGYILTSNHVIDKAEEIQVALADETVFEAELIGSDHHTDLAVLKIIDPGDHDLVPIEPGNSDTLRIGEFAIAIGSPFSLSSSVTLGIVSQKHRSLDMFAFEDFIQTDAAINPGNSGGPLVDAHGKLIGINAVIQTSGSGDNAGVGFAIPGNRAFEVAKQLIEQGSVERPWLGILPQSLDPRSAKRVLGTTSGVYVADVFRNTPAYKSGLYRGDILLKVDNEPIASILDLQRAIFTKAIGESIKLTIFRSNRKLVVDVVTERMPDEKMFRR